MIRLLFAAAVALFVLHLPIRTTGLGVAMRRWAGFCFLAALLPSLIVGLLFPEGLDLAFSSHPVAATAVVIVAIGVSYGVYTIRKWLREDPAKKQQRMLEKTPIERSRRQHDLFAFLADNQPPEGPRS